MVDCVLSFLFLFFCYFCFMFCFCYFSFFLLRFCFFWRTNTVFFVCLLCCFLLSTDVLLYRMVYCVELCTNKYYVLIVYAFRGNKGEKREKAPAVFFYLIVCWMISATPYIVSTKRSHETVTGLSWWFHEYEFRDNLSC